MTEWKHNIQHILRPRRLNPDNSHQVPLVVVLCGPTRAGVLGMATARHLATQGVRTVVYLPDLPNHLSNSEFSLYKLTGQRWTTKVKGTNVTL
jgi:enhancer of mRNA-decapping protein 3